MSTAQKFSFEDTATFAGESRELIECKVSGGARTVFTIHHSNKESSLAPEKCAAILLIPGWSGPRCGPADFLVQLARALAQQGHLVARTDLTGRGDATGSFESCDLDKMIDDAGAVLERLADYAAYPKNIVVGGICSGANVALGVATAKAKLVTHTLSYSILPYQPSRSESFERRRRWKNLKNYASKALKPGTWAKLLRGEVQMKKVTQNLTGSEKPATAGGKSDRNLKDSARDIEKELLDWKGNALFVWGSADEEAALAEKHFRGLHEKGMANKATFHTVANANHNYYSRAWRDELEQVTLKFLSGGN